jgi:hypothetical protein
MNGTDLISLALQFLHTLSDAIGSLITDGIRAILPDAQFSDSLSSTIGLLAVTSLLLALAEFAKKAAWVVVIVGWILVIVRITIWQ